MQKKCYFHNLKIRHICHLKEYKNKVYLNYNKLISNNKET